MLALVLDHDPLTCNTCPCVREEYDHEYGYCVHCGVTGHGIDKNVFERPSDCPLIEVKELNIVSPFFFGKAYGVVKSDMLVHKEK